MPLLGRRILVTRATSQASTLSEQLRALGAAVTEMPATRVEPLDRAPLIAAITGGGISRYRHIVFTSQNAVHVVWDTLRAAGLDARAFAGIVVSAVGPATAGALLEHGIAVDVSPKRFVAEGVLEALASRSDIHGARVLYPAATGARDALPAGLRQLGAMVDVIPVYRSVFDGTDAAALCARLAAGELDLVTVTSASAVRGYRGSGRTGARGTGRRHFDRPHHQRGGACAPGSRSSRKPIHSTIAAPRGRHPRDCRRPPASRTPERDA